LTSSPPGRGGRLHSVVIETLAITPSGALSPGFLSASAIAVGSMMGALGGLMVSLGHILFELPYVGLLVYWAEKLESKLKRFERPLALATAAMALYMAIGLVGAALDGDMGELAGKIGVRGDGLLYALGLGVWFTAFNPYFLIWWVTIGLPLVRSAASYGAKGFTVMYFSHVWIDLAWLTLLATAGGLLSKYHIVYSSMLLALAAMLIAFAADMLLRSFSGRRLLPF